MTSIKKITTAIIAAVFGLSVASLPLTTTPASAASVSRPSTTAVNTFGVETAILDGCANKEEAEKNGAGIICILGLVVNIMTIGIGILAVIGITVSGIQYITAGGSEEQTRKAKRRIFEIVLGLAAYAASYLLLHFLLPGFNGIIQ